MTHFARYAVVPATILRESEESPSGGSARRRTRLENGYLAAGFFAAGFLAAGLRAAGFLAAGWRAAGFLAAAEAVFAAGFAAVLAAGFLAAGFLAAGLRAAGFF